MNVFAIRVKLLSFPSLRKHSGLKSLYVFRLQGLHRVYTVQKVKVGTTELGVLEISFSVYQMDSKITIFTLQ